MRGMNERMAVQAAIEEILNTPPKEPTQEEAVDILIRSGVMTKNHKIKKVYQQFLVKADDTYEEDDTSSI